MAHSKQQITTDISAHMKKGGGSYSSWYVGISKDPRDRLFSQHKVQEDGDWWIYRQAISGATARDVEEYFINTLKTDGGPGGGDQTADYVYAYKKSSHTDP
jgi:hypothetical protein